MPYVAEDDEVENIRLPALFLRYGSDPYAPLRTALKFTSTTRIAASYGTSSNHPDSPIPALFHIMSRPPSALPPQKSASAASRAGLSVTSTWRVQIRSGPSCPASEVRPSALRSMAPTRQPRVWKC